ncbi:MAG: tyrosine-type recombinase/integrase [Actinomycetota bacterium]|nr:tyrosine-type recombinase/integrase [Actinomycetota bacterium]
MVKARKQREPFGAIRQRDSGRFQASYVGLDGVRHNAPMTFDTKGDARGWLARQRVAMLSGEWVDPATESALRASGKQTLGAYAERWIETRTNPSGAQLRPRTRDEYERLLRTTLAPLLEQPIRNVDAATVRSWYSALVRSGRQTLAARSYSLLRSIYATALEDGVVSENPARIKGAGNASTGRKVTPPSAAELEVMAEHMPDRLKAAVLIAAWAGVRYGELTELRRKDLQLVDIGGAPVYVVDVSRGVVRTRSGFVVGPTKSAAGVRQITLPPHVSARVSAHLAAHVAADAEALLFPAPNGSTHLAQATFVRSWYPARKAAGRDDLPWHGLRHFGATRAALAGATLKELQARLGHSTVVAAMRYQHTAGRDRELAQRMSALHDSPAG